MNGSGSITEELRGAQTDWLRGFPRGFWRDHAPELWNRLLPGVRDIDPPLEFWNRKFDLTLRDAFDGGACPLGAPAIDRLVRTWAQGLAREIDHHILVAYTIALTDGGRRPHVHGFLSGPPTIELSFDRPLDRWTSLSGWCGPHSVFETYDPDQGAVRYAIDHGGLFLPKIACPRNARCRKGKCIGAAQPWHLSAATMFEGRAANRRTRFRQHGFR